MVIGAGIAGSVTARFTSEAGLRTLMLERMKTPRDKACSGVQLPYMEKLIGTKIPEDRLCTNTLNKVKLTTPGGRTLTGRIRMLNYWRRDLDHWLNTVAVDHGCEFRDEAKVQELKQETDHVSLMVDGEEIKSKYVVGADGLSPSSFTRRRLDPGGFSPGLTGTAVNYYFRGSSEVDPGTLHVYYRRSYSDLMFSWLYYKDELLVAGTSSSRDIAEHAEGFYKRVKDEYSLDGEVVRKEGYATSCLGGVLLGKGDVILAGDAAGLLDLYRGVGMDTAALSGRLAASAIVQSISTGEPLQRVYEGKTRRLVGVLERNNRRQEERYRSDESLERSLSTGSILRGLAVMTAGQLWNRLCEPERVMLLPP